MLPLPLSLVDNISVTVPIAETPENIKAVQQAFHLCGQNGGIIFPALTGAYSPALLEHLGKDAPDIQAGDLEIIHQPLDAIGLNIYSGTYVQARVTISENPTFTAINENEWEIYDNGQTYPVKVEGAINSIKIIRQSDTQLDI